MTFHRTSKQIVKDYLGTVAYVDDLIFTERKETTPEYLGELEIRTTSADNTSIEGTEAEENKGIEPLLERNIVPLTFTNSFLEQGIQCALLEITNEDDSLDPIKNILKKSDVIILDWQMHRDLGRKATELMLSVLKEPNNQELRLIIIFTNDPNYNTIIPEKIVPELERINIENIKQYDTGCRISFGHTKIAVFSKENGVKTDDSVSDEELPERILEEFTEFTEGLVTNTVLNAITILRRNTHTLLGVFNNNLDHAYLAHRALLPVPEDAEILLKNTIVDSIGSIMSYSNITSTCNIDMIKSWFDINNHEEKELSFSSLPRVTINDELRKEWLEIGYKDFINSIHIKNGKEKLSEKQMDSYDKEKLLRGVSHCFVPENNNSSEDFAILTHHKSNFITPYYTPKLALGVIMQRFYEYFLCIQQKCDSVRIKPYSARKFLFLPLEETDKHFSILFKNEDNKYIKLKINNKNSYHIQTIYFDASKNGSVVAEKKFGTYNFIDCQKRSYKWILDLNETHAQKIVNEFAAAISRVGIDESEWLRRSL